MKIALTLLTASLAAAQSFEVASVKPNAANDHRIMIRMEPGGRFVATGITLRLLIGQAFNVRDFQITGGPSWMADQAWDINAKAEGVEGGGRMGPERLRPMLQNLLKERFALKYREESKEMPAYDLVVGKNGHKLKPGEAPAQGGPRGQMRMGRGQLSAKGVEMKMFANQLSQQVGRTVVDKTGLSGNWDVEVTWTPEPGQGFGPFGGRGPGGAEPPPPPSGDGPTLFTALQEQLGLKLESSKGPTPILIIESVSKPTEN